MAISRIPNVPDPPITTSDGTSLRKPWRIFFQQLAGAGAETTQAEQAAPPVRAFTAGTYDEDTQIWGPVLAYDVLAENMLIDWGCILPDDALDGGLANWSGVQIWIKRPDPDNPGQFTYHQATGLIGRDAFDPPTDRGVHYDQIKIERKHVPAAPEEWFLIACSFNAQSSPNLDVNDLPIGPTVSLTTVVPPAAPFTPVEDVDVLALTPTGSLDPAMGGENPHYTLDANGVETVGIQLRVTPPSDDNWLRPAIYWDPGTGELEGIAEYPYDAVVPAPVDLQPIWRARPPANITWRFVPASIGKNGIRGLPDLAEALDVPVTAIQGIGYPTIGVVTIEGDLWEGKQTGAVKVTIPYTAPTAGQFTGVTLFFKKPGDTEFVSIAYYPHLGGADGLTDSVIVYQDRPLDDEDWELILSPRTAWHGEDLFRHADDRNFKLIAVPAIGPALATGITDAAVGTLSYPRTQDGVVYWAIDHVTWTNPAGVADVNFFFSRLTVQKVDAAGTPATDAEGVERVVFEQQWAGYAVDCTLVNYWTLPAAAATYRRFRFRLYAINWKRAAVLQTTAWGGAAYLDVIPTEQGAGLRADMLDPLTLGNGVEVNGGLLRIRAGGGLEFSGADLQVKVSTGLQLSAGSLSVKYNSTYLTIDGDGKLIVNGVRAQDVIAGQLVVGVTIVASQIISGTISASVAYAGTIAANQITAGTISAAVSLTAPTITVTSGAVTINIDGTNYVKVTSSASGAVAQLTGAGLEVRSTVSPSRSATILQDTVSLADVSGNVIAVMYNGNAGGTGYGKFILSNGSTVKITVDASAGDITVAGFVSFLTLRTSNYAASGSPAAAATHKIPLYDAGGSLLNYVYLYP